MANRKFQTRFLNYDSTKQYVEISGHVNAATLINVGNPAGPSAGVLIENSLFLSQGQSLVIEGNENEEIHQNLKYVFQGAGAQNLVVILKIYVD
jgi:hypothetical protein